MRINKDLQYAILFCLYVYRGGVVTVEVAAQNLGLSSQFLMQISRKLRIAGILESVRGPGGGYTFLKEPRIIDIFRVFDTRFLSREEVHNYTMRSEPEHRAMLYLFEQMDLLLHPIFELKISKLMDFLVRKEVAIIEDMVLPEKEH